MEFLKGKITHRLNGLVLSSLLFFPIKVSASEQSHATFKVENVGTIEQSGGQVTRFLPSTNDLIDLDLILLGVLFLLLCCLFNKFKKGTLYEK